VLLAGCPQVSSDVTEGQPPKVGESALSSESINLVVGDEKKLAEMIAANKGKVVFVDYWATWCEPCVEYFPHTVELHHKYKDRGLAVIGVTFDEPEEEQTAREFLAQHGADFEHLLNQYGVGTEATEKFELDQVPHFRLYNRQGELVKKWDEKPEDADKLIEELLAGEAGTPAEASTPAASESPEPAEE
jgi:thiol-disulfide isomerase/thioredoxin